MTATALERPAPVRGFLRLVMIEHSVFALPFAYVAALTAMERTTGSVDWPVLGLVTLAMVSGRTFAMAANRVVDRELDARNPRTANRELVTGALSVRTAVVGMLVSLAVFVATVLALNPLAAALSPIALALLFGYPYAKRFTWLCHAVLGLAQAVAPMGAWIAVTGEWSWTPVPLALGMGAWIAGFDLIYACQDAEHDSANGVHSLPGRFGKAAALRASTVVHVAAVALLAVFDLGVWWWVGVGLAATALAYEHAIVKPDDLSMVNRAFFTVNGYIAVGLLGFAVLALVAE